METALGIALLYVMIIIEFLIIHFSMKEPLPWKEMVFAPPIIQKYFYHIISKLDEFIEKPFKNSILVVYKHLFKLTKGVFNMSFFASKAEEFLHLFRSKYIYFLFPDVEKNAHF